MFIMLLIPTILNADLPPNPTKLTAAMIKGLNQKKLLDILDKKPDNQTPNYLDVIVKDKDLIEAFLKQVASKWFITDLKTLIKRLDDKYKVPLHAFMRAEKSNVTKWWAILRGRGRGNTMLRTLRPKAEAAAAIGKAAVEHAAIKEITGEVVGDAAENINTAIDTLKRKIETPSYPKNFAKDKITPIVQKATATFDKAKRAIERQQNFVETQKRQTEAVAAQLINLTTEVAQWTEVDDALRELDTAM